MDVIGDVQIEEYIKERKVLSQDFKSVLKDKGRMYVFDQEIIGLNGSTFKIIIRQSKINPLDFSIIFGVLLGGDVFRIRRYNGDSHVHKNKIEDENVSGFHIHHATERYQDKGFKEEGYAKKTDRYSDWKSALKIMIKENNFEFEIDKTQRRLDSQ